MWDADDDYWLADMRRSMGPEAFSEWAQEQVAAEEARQAEIDKWNRLLAEDGDEVDTPIFVEGREQ